MILRAKTGRWLRRLAVCVLLVTLALVFLNRSSALHLRGSQLNRAKAQAKLGSVEVSRTHAPALHISSVLQHGHIIEIQGSTDSGAVVMINGQTATTVFEGNAFRQFLGPFPTGTTIITVTSQDEQGGVNTRQVAVTVE